MIDVTLSSVWSALGYAVLQFLWQGAVVGLLAGAVLRLLRRGTSDARHAVAALALVLCLAAFATTFVLALADAAGPVVGGRIHFGRTRPRGRRHLARRQPTRRLRRGNQGARAGRHESG